MLAGGQSSAHSLFAGGRYPYLCGWGENHLPSRKCRNCLGRNSAPKGRVDMCNHHPQAWGRTRRHGELRRQGAMAPSIASKFGACSLRVFVDGQEANIIDVPTVLLRPRAACRLNAGVRDHTRLGSTENHQLHRRAARNAPSHGQHLFGFRK